MQLIPWSGSNIRLQLGGTTNAFPAIKRNAAMIDFRLADDSGFASANADSFYGQGYYGLRSDARVLIGGSLIKTLATGVIALQNSGETSFDRLVLGVGTNAFPSIKRNGAAIDFRLADDSGYADVNMGQATFGGGNGYIGINNSASIDSALRAIRTNSGSSPLSISTGEVGVGDATTYASAIFAIGSTTRGFLPPRMTTTQKNAIATPATGLVLYDTTLNKLAVYTGSAWETVTSL
jgi:hypothetical protein